MRAALREWLDLYYGAPRPGEGPALTWADWPGFVPAAVEGAALVQYVLPMRLRGKPHHVEAGAWWNGSGTGVRSLTR